MSNIIVPNKIGEQLRDLAAHLGLKIKRGPGAFEDIGSIRLLLMALASSYEDEPDRVASELRQVLRLDDAIII
jgi:hypothetical protein